MTKSIQIAILLLLTTVFPSRAAFYIVGNIPFGDWNPAAGVEMTDNGDGTYSYVAAIDNTVWFVFANGLNSDWSTFNDNYRYGPTTSFSLELSLGVPYTAKKNKTNNTFFFTGDGREYIITFNSNTLQFRIDDYQEMSIPDPINFLPGDADGDGRVTISDLTTMIDLLMNGKVNYDIIRRCDINHDNALSIDDLTFLIDYLLSGVSQEPVKEGYDYVWDEMSLPEIHIEVSQSEWNRLLELYDENKFTTQYVMANMTFIKDGEETAIDSVGLRLKGNTSRMRPEGVRNRKHQTDNTNWHHAHFGLSLQKYVDDDAHTIQGIRKLHLKWFNNDPMYVREVFCFDLFKRAGVWTALRDIYCRLWIHVEGDSKEAYYGVYGMLEPIDKRYLRDRLKKFGSANGYLWKCRNEAAGLNNPNGDIWYDDDTDKRHAYTLQTQIAEFDEAKAQLIDFMDKLCNLDDNEFYTWIQEVTDVDLLLKTYAVSVAIGMWDDYWNNANNYYIYFNGRELSGYKFFFIPYDYDNTLGTSHVCGVQNDAGRQDPLHWGNDINPLIARILSYDKFRAAYVKHLKELISDNSALLDRVSAQSRIRGWHKKIKDYVDNDTNEDCVIEDKPASWGNHNEYNLMNIDTTNFFIVKANVIKSIE